MVGILTDEPGFVSHVELTTGKEKNGEERKGRKEIRLTQAISSPAGCIHLGEKCYGANENGSLQLVAEDCFCFFFF